MMFQFVRLAISRQLGLGKTVITLIVIAMHHNVIISLENAHMAVTMDGLVQPVD